MSIEKERELFELWCIKDDEFCIHKYDGSDDYSDDYTQCAWMAWQASANRKGYKHVPVEPCEKTLNAMWEALDGNAESMDCIERSYKAMIGAVDD